jgi:hypothetical protein
MTSDFAMKQQFLDAMDIHLRTTIKLQIMPENTVDTILTIAENYNTANHATGIYGHPGSKRIASNAIVQVKSRQQS